MEETKHNSNFTTFIDSYFPQSLFNQHYTLIFVNPHLEKQYDDFWNASNSKYLLYHSIASTLVAFLFFTLEIILFQLLYASNVLFGIVILQISILFISVLVLVLKNSVKMKKWLIFMNNISVHLNIIILGFFLTITEKEDPQSKFEKNIFIAVFCQCLTSGFQILLYPYDNFCPVLIVITLCFDLTIFLFISLFSHVYTDILALIPYWLFVNYLNYVTKHQLCQLQRKVFINSLQANHIFHHFDAIINNSNSIIYSFKARDLIYKSLNGQRLIERLTRSESTETKCRDPTCMNVKTKCKEASPSEIDFSQLKKEASINEHLNRNSIFNNISPKVRESQTFCAESLMLLKNIVLQCGQEQNVNYENPNDLLQLISKEYPGKKKINLNKVMKYFSKKKENEIGNKLGSFTYLAQSALDFNNVHIIFEVFIKVNYYYPAFENKVSSDSPLIELLLNDITQNVNNQNDKREQNLIKSHFAHLIHEFKTPLNAIISASAKITAAVQETFINSNMAMLSTVSNITSLCHYVQFLIKDIIDVSQGKDYSFHFTTVHLSEILSFCYNVLISLISLSEAKQKNINPSLVQEYLSQNEEEDITLNTDETRLKQIVLNLLSNSVKFTSRGFIELKAYLNEAHNQLFISVRDTGSGMKEEDKASIFREDTVIDQSIANQFGSGLGLVISNSIAMKLGMKMDVDSIWQKGTIFRLTIDLLQQCSKTDRPNRVGTCLLFNEDTVHPHKPVITHSHKDLHILNPTQRLTKDLLSIEYDIKHTVPPLEFKEQKTVRNVQQFDFSYNHPDIVSFLAHDQKNPPMSHRETARDIPILINKTSINEYYYSHKGSIKHSPSGGRKNSDLGVIIVIDDLKDARTSFLNSISCICSKNKKAFTILEGPDGIDCLKLVIDNCSNVKCVLMDENMEYLGGSETGRILKHLMNSNKINQFPIIEISSGSKKEAYPPYDFAISKPVEKSKLEDVLKTIHIL